MIALAFAQRLSASQRWAHQGARAVRRRSIVLNAFRHHRGGHIPRFPGMGSQLSAQRLSASQRWARCNSLPLVGITVKCSTPFGITEVGTPASSRVSWSGCGAQRLSASQRWALIRRSCRPCQGAVLNAFRHHRGGHIRALAGKLPCRGRCSTPFGITEVGTRSRGRWRRSQPVLNAFRHHRGGHCAFGVQEEWSVSVLNAFRHHRGGHNSRLLRSISPRVCSTPFGITEVGTALMALAFFALTSAQRLSASQRWARPERRQRADLARVLNAFRHHRGGHTRSGTRSPFGSPCSTPFGITEVGTGWPRASHDRGIVLNAFRHHRGGHPVAWSFGHQ